MSRHPLPDDTPRFYRAVIGALRPPIAGLTRQDWSGAEHLPRDGGFIIAANHISEIDPFMLGHFLVDHGLAPTFLAKSSLFDLPVVGHALRWLDQVPVYRGSTRAGEALAGAEQAVRDGRCVVILPEGTLTRDPDLWPMKGKTGVGRLALATGAPVIPVAQWGPQQLLGPYARVPHVTSRVRMQVAAGAPVELGDLAGQERAVLAQVEATRRVMLAITGLLASLRGQQPPAEPFDPARRGAGA